MQQVVHMKRQRNNIVHDWGCQIMDKPLVHPDVEVHGNKSIGSPRMLHAVQRCFCLHVRCQVLGLQRLVCDWRKVVVVHPLNDSAPLICVPI